MSLSTRSRLRRTATALSIVLALATVSCGSDGRSGEQQSAENGPDVADTDDPNADKIAAIVRDKLTELDLSGAVFGVWRGDEEIAAGAVGESPLGVPATRDMQLRVGQPMEPMLSTILLQLGEAGTLILDEPIAKWVPDFPRADKITPRMLANSTTGISDYVTNPDFLKIFYANPIKGFTSQEIFDLANARPPLFEPGTSFAYAHSDLCLLGVVLEKAAGKPLGDLLKERIFTPLGMDASSVVLTPQMSEPILHGYTNERGVFEDSTFWNPTAFLNSGNMNSTVAEVARWVRALGTGELLSDTAFTEMMADKTAGLGPLTADKYFAFGTVHLGSWLLMNPAFGGYNGIALYETESKTTIVVYATLGPTANANANNTVPIGKEIGALLFPDNPPKVP
ncbi:MULTISPECIES: serine hydrolase domain-containing protein [Rhodococcus]|uniref:Serine hydrolase domain-containing protein n=1 Tax=Rhodococcus jostii TaxID=132919 RepID=A0ABU4CGQ3_RHOJO|nr:MULTISPECIES: serine hydrolase domain-containing protein [Rhodococcus]MDI9948252.1 serine hydrolase domain-containing protein [Rhodococcus sp. IEGM 1305]MDV6282430.1 serine hydrolase domain-containing protein [Rhodococcus jostii]